VPASCVRACASVIESRSYSRAPAVLRVPYIRGSAKHGERAACGYWPRVGDDWSRAAQPQGLPAKAQGGAARYPSPSLSRLATVFDLIGRIDDEHAPRVLP
jgi:hypothetical protein